MGVVGKARKLSCCFGMSGIMVAVLIVGVVLVGVLAGALYMLVPHSVAGSSMEPTVSDGQYIVGLRNVLGNVKRGDIVVYKYEAVEGLETDIIGRVVGLPENSVEIKNGRLYINDKPERAEHYADAGFLVDENFIGSDAGPDMEKVMLDDGEYFIIGDNRENSMDSRNHGPIPADKVSDVIFWVR